jgi:hypothetical protein
LSYPENIFQVKLSVAYEPNSDFFSMPVISRDETVTEIVYVPMSDAGCPDGIFLIDFLQEVTLKRIIFFIIVLGIAWVLPVQAKNDIYGKGVSLTEVTPVSAILDNPDSYIGQMVRVQGMIIEVCAKRGCWIYVAGDRPGEKIQVKVTDGEIVFPMSASGRLGIVEGIVEELKLSREDMIKYLQHLAEEKGQPFDPSTVKDERMIRLRGLGAEIEG